MNLHKHLESINYLQMNIGSSRLNDWNGMIIKTVAYISHSVQGYRKKIYNFI